MPSETIDIHVGISAQLTKQEVEALIENARGFLINGNKYELFRDEGKDNWQVWGEARESQDDPWHLIIRVEYHDWLFYTIVHRGYEEFKALLGDRMRELEYEGQQLAAVITDSDDWSACRGGRARNIPV